MGEMVEKLADGLKNDNRSDITIEITVTNMCNCNCDYCFECTHDDTSSREEETRQLKLISESCENFNRTEHRFLNIVFWGGEPMMNTGFLFDIIEKTKDYDFVRYMMYSNGLLSEKYEDFLNQSFIDSISHRFEIQFSYDGEPHHATKRHSNGESVIKTAEIMHRRGFNIGFKATLSLDSLDMLPEVWDSYMHLHEKFPFIRYSPTLDQTNRNNNDEAFETWKRILPEIAKKEKRFIQRFGTPLWTWFSKPGKLACNLNNTVNIHCDGNFYVCHGCQYGENSDCFILGNTKTATHIEDFLNSGFKPSLRLEECVRCPAVVCAVCHVSELSKNRIDAKNYKDAWTSIMVNNSNRCRFFKYFAKIYYVLKMSLITGQNK